MTKKTLFCALLGGALMNAGNAWAEDDVLQSYVKGTSDNKWTAEVLAADWTQSYVTLSVAEDGLSVSGTTTNGGWTVVKSITPESATSIFTLEATLTGGGASGRAGSYDYITIGGFTFKSDGSSQKAYVSIDGVDTEITFPGRNATSTISVSINQATEDIEWTVNSTEGKGSSSTAISKVEWGHNKAGRENYGITCTLGSLSITETAQDVTTAEYTIKYVDGEGTEIRDRSGRTGVVGAPTKVNAADKADFIIETGKYIYQEDNAASTTIAGDNSSVVTVVFRQAAIYSFSVNTSLGDILAFGTEYEGETVTFDYGRYALSGSKLYSAAKQASSPWWGSSIVVNTDNQEETVAYTEAVDNVVYFSEAEDIDGATASRSANADIRCSFGTGGFFASDKTLTTLSAGIYTITTSVWGNAGTTFEFTAGETTVHTNTTTGSINDATSESFAVAADGTAITALAAGDGSHVLDFVYITKVADESVSAPEINEADGLVSIAGAEANTGATVCVYYTTDGSEPTPESELYTEPFSVDESCTVKAIAVSDNGTESDMASKEIEVTVTAVEKVEATKTADDAIYTLGGVKVGKATRGIYVSGGKLIIVK